MPATWSLRSIDWGDGGSGSGNTNGPGAFTRTNVYNNQGSYTITATFRDAASQSVTSVATATVTDVAPVIASATLSRLTNTLGPSYRAITLTCEWSDPGYDTHSITVELTPASGTKVTRTYDNLPGTRPRLATLTLPTLSTVGRYAVAVTVADVADTSAKAVYNLPDPIVISEPPSPPPPPFRSPPPSPPPRPSVTVGAAAVKGASATGLVRAFLNTC